jgi:DNA-binding NarL/FixJ family response regulator
MNGQVALGRFAPTQVRVAKAPHLATTHLFTEVEWDNIGSTLGLTVRQLDVARLLCDQCTYYTIGARLGISVDTVRMHMRSLFAKLDAHTPILTGIGRLSS